MDDRLSREEVSALVGPADDEVLTEILKLGVNRTELTEAYAWLENGEVLSKDGRHPPSGRVARLIEILQACDEDLSEAPKP
ncbi:hypothetical protein [Microvirga puerhi]|uniref:Uncharacterized protein n=1 Tax=Microvirga puerhi TaxID=2876078 RepID=A0ABS7VU62_9HYPH|nr:hypothetical protein [Microvirga puerhi]MBZ6079123.1 hypothetical protein [Microvirga puerhi]